MASTHKPSQPIAVLDESELQYESEEYINRVAYSYSTLPGPRSFRLLVLLPGTPESTLQCELDIKYLDDDGVPESYTAISYTWNPSKFDEIYIGRRRIPITHGIHKRFSIRHPVWCNDTRLLVSTSLYNLLRRLQDPKNCICLWIDALCINQDDLDERADQVLLMKDIYSHAYNVVLWLGEEDEETEKAYALAKSLAHHPDADPVTKVTCSVPMSGADLAKGSGLPRLGLPPEEAPEWKALFRLFARPVFKRTWIIQEISFSRFPPFSLCGSHRILLPELVGAMLFLQSCGWRDMIAARMETELFNAHRYAFDIMRVRIGTAYGSSRTHISVSLPFEASDPRDKIYAMLGVLPLSKMPAEYKALLYPDYRKPVHTVYRDATIAFIAADSHLAVMSLARRNSRINGTFLPSWVPDYSVENRGYASLIGLDPDANCPYKASASESPGRVSIPGKSNLISLRGYCVGAANLIAVEDSTQFETPQLLEWTFMIRKLPCIYEATGEEIEEALWRTLIGDRGINRTEKTFADAAEMREAFKDVLRFFTAQVLDSTITLSETIMRHFESFVSAFIYNMAGRKFFLTQNGLMGMGAPSIRSGDLIYIVAGAQVPFVLRRSSTTNEVWSLVGDCYVHGIMQGECLARTDFAWKEIILE